MIDLSECLVIGKISKTHGVRGQVILWLNELSFEDIIEMETVFIEIDGLPVPFFISDFIEKNKQSLILSIDDLTSENKAKDLVDCRVFVPRNSVEINHNPMVQAGSILGYEVYDAKLGKLGILDDILNFQENPLFRILAGTKEILVPVQEEFIINISHTDKRIMLAIPEGLADLF